MAETVVWACRVTDALSRISAEGRASRRAPDLHPTTVSIDECTFHSAGSSGDLSDLHDFHNPSTLSLLFDTVVGWRQLELISARSCALTLWILGSDAYATYMYAGAEAAPVAHCGP